MGHTDLRTEGSGWYLAPVDAISGKSIVAATSLAVLWVIEGLLPMFEGRTDRPRHDMTNLVLGVGNAVVASALFAGATLLVTQWSLDNRVGLLHLLPLGPVATAFLAVLALDFWQYWWHRFNHAVPLLWRFHAVHHADRELDASSGLRFHTGEIILSSIARLAVLPLLGLTIQQVLLYELILLPVILFHHSNVRLPAAADRALRWLIVTPRMHWVHHSDYQPETDSNYSSVLSVWDRLFRSFRLVRDPRELTLGLDGTAYSDWRTLKGMLLMPFQGRARQRIERTQGVSDPEGSDGGGPPGSDGR